MRLQFKLKCVTVDQFEQYVIDLSHPFLPEGFIYNHGLIRTLMASPTSRETRGIGEDKQQLQDVWCCDHAQQHRPPNAMVMKRTVSTNWLVMVDALIRSQSLLVFQPAEDDHIQVLTADVRVKLPERLGSTLTFGLQFKHQTGGTQYS